MNNLSKTCWSCNPEAVKALAHGYHQIHEVLSEINNDEDQIAIVRNEALGLLRNMAHLEITITRISGMRFLANLMQLAHTCKVLR